MHARVVVAAGADGQDSAPAETQATLSESAPELPVSCPGMCSHQKWSVSLTVLTQKAASVLSRIVLSLVSTELVVVRFVLLRNTGMAEAIHATANVRNQRIGGCGVANS